MASVKVVVSKADGTSYDVRVGENLIDQLGTDIMDRFDPQKVFLLYDGTVTAEDHGRVKTSLREQGVSVTSCKLPSGQPGHELGCATEIWQAMASAGITHECLVVGLGGPQTMNMAGFVSKLYTGGIPVVAVPTTLTTACIHCLGGFASALLERSFVGQYTYPDYACIDVSMFDEMPRDQWIDGFALIAEMAVLGSDDFYFWLTDSADDLVDHDHGTVIRAVAQAVSLLADARADDISGIIKESPDPISVSEAQMCLTTATNVPRSQQILRYGDELASALVTLGKAQSWGRAHAEGMRFSMHVASETFDTSIDLVKSQDDLFLSLGLDPIEIDFQGIDLLHTLEQGPYGKKGGVEFVLPLDVGQSMTSIVSMDVLHQQIEEWIKEHE